MYSCHQPLPVRLPLCVSQISAKLSEATQTEPISGCSDRLERQLLYVSLAENQLFMIRLVAHMSQCVAVQGVTERITSLQHNRGKKIKISDNFCTF